MSDNNKVIPDRVLKNMGLKTSREFKSLKRKQLRDIKKMVSEYCRGCAYVPHYDEITELHIILANIQTMQSVKEWGH